VVPQELDTTEPTFEPPLVDRVALTVPDAADSVGAAMHEGATVTEGVLVGVMEGVREGEVQDW
jgi:hypothetical protein